MKRYFENHNVMKLESRYKPVYGICPQCGKEVSLPCLDCQRAEAEAYLKLCLEEPERRRYAKICELHQEFGVSIPPERLAAIAD